MAKQLQTRQIAVDRERKLTDFGIFEGAIVSCCSALVLLCPTAAVTYCLRGPPLLYPPSFAVGRSLRFQSGNLSECFGNLQDIKRN